MLEGGEDPRFIARRMVILASEDIGNADPRALEIAVAAAHAVEHVGLPECALNLVAGRRCTSRWRRSRTPRTRRSAARARGCASTAPPIPPAPLRSAAYAGAKALGRGEGYDYPHDHPEGVSTQELMPPEAEGERFLELSDHGEERELDERLERIEGRATGCLKRRSGMLRTRYAHWPQPIGPANVLQVRTFESRAQSAWPIPAPCSPPPTRWTRPARAPAPGAAQRRHAACGRSSRGSRAETRERRFLAAMPQVPDTMVRHFTFFDPRERLVVVATAMLGGPRGDRRPGRRGAARHRARRAGGGGRRRPAGPRAWASCSPRRRLARHAAGGHAPEGRAAREQHSDAGLMQRLGRTMTHRRGRHVSRSTPRCRPPAAAPPDRRSRLPRAG